MSSLEQHSFIFGAVSCAKNQLESMTAMKDAIISLPMKVSLAYSNLKKELHV